MYDSRRECLNLNQINTKRIFRDNTVSRRRSIAGYATDEDRGIGRKRPLYWFEVRIIHFLIC